MSFHNLAAAPFLFPTTLNNPIITWSGSTGVPGFTAGTIDAAGEKVAFIGRIYWTGAPASAKTVSSSSKIKIRTNTVTFADAATNLRVGIQDVLATGTTFPTPDGTFDVYADFAGNSGTPLSSASDFVAVEFNLSTGSKSITHGDLIAIVFDLTARGGADSVTIAGHTGPTTKLLPVTLNYVASWAQSQAAPLCVITSDDGTVGILYGTTCLTSATQLNIAAADSPDEHGLIFQVPYRCKINGLYAIISTTDTNSDFEIKLYSTPLGTPSALATITVPGDQGNASVTESPSIYLLATELELQPNTDYCVAIAATGTTDITVVRSGLFTDVQSICGYANCREGARTNGTGAFSETTGQVIQAGIMISAIDDGTGFGRASFNLGV